MSNKGPLDLFYKDCLRIGNLKVRVRGVAWRGCGGVRRRVRVQAGCVVLRRPSFLSPTTQHKTVCPEFFAHPLGPGGAGGAGVHGRAGGAHAAADSRRARRRVSERESARTWLL